MKLQEWLKWAVTRPGEPSRREPPWVPVPQPPEPTREPVRETPFVPEGTQAFTCPLNSIGEPSIAEYCDAHGLKWVMLGRRPDNRCMVAVAGEGVGGLVDLPHVSAVHSY